MKARLPFSILVAIAGAGLSGYGICATITPVALNGQLGFTLSQPEMDQPSLQKSLKSGFKTTILYRAQLRVQSDVKATHNFGFDAVYDTWDEEYRIQSSGGELSSPQVYKSLADVLARVTQTQLLNLVPLGSLDPKQSYVIEVSTWVDPIQKDRAEMIQKWAAENNLSTSISPGAAAGTRNQLRTGHNNPVLSALFDQYLHDEIGSVTWKNTVRSAAFKPIDLPKVSQ